MSGFGCLGRRGASGLKLWAWALGVALLAAGPAGAAPVDYYWLNSGGGDFHQWDRWARQPNPDRNDFSQLAPGDGDDTNIFQRGATPASRYRVGNVGGVPAADGGPWTNDRFIITSDALTLEFAGPVVLSNTTSALSQIDLPSLTVGRDSGDVGDLWLTRSVSSGALTTQDAVLGWAAGSVGRITVDELAWTLAGSGRLVVGQRGEGALTIQNGATVTGGTAYLGDAANSSGTIDILSGGSLTTAAGTTSALGGAEGASGTVNVSGAGSRWDAGIIRLGANVGSEGSLHIADGGQVDASTTILGFNDQTTGTITVTGEGSRLDSSFRIIVGSGGQGTLTIQDGGTVDVQSTDTRFPSAILGNTASGNGTVTVTGAGSTWTTNLDMIVGDVGRGTLHILDGGLVDVGGHLTLGQQSSSSGSVHLDAGSLSVGGDLTLGDAGAATLELLNGSTLSVAGSVTANASATLVLEDSRFETGTIDAAVASALDWRSGTLGLGTLRLDDGEPLGPTLTLADNRTLEVADLTLGAPAVLTLDPGGTARITNRFTPASGRQVFLQGGRLELPLLDDDALAALAWRSGTLRLPALRLDDGEPFGRDLRLDGGQTLDVDTLELASVGALTLHASGATIVRDAITADPGASILLDGGTLDIPRFGAGAADAFSWTTGTLRLGELNLGEGQPFGPSLTLTAGQTLDLREPALGFTHPRHAHDRARRRADLPRPTHLEHVPRRQR